MTQPRELQPSGDVTLQALRSALATGDAELIRAALPEPPQFLRAVFDLEPPERDAILAGVFPALDTDEDHWELIEAAAMDSVARPERGALLAVVPYITNQLLDDTLELVKGLNRSELTKEVMTAIQSRLLE